MTRGAGYRPRNTALVAKLVLLDEDLQGPSRLGDQIVSPVGADAVFAARALVGEQGARAAEAVHRALEEFAPGGIVRDAGDLPACIELRALADEHFGPWIAPEYAAQVVTRPVILHVQERLEARNQPLGVRNVVHIKAGPGCCKTTTARALVTWLGAATARHFADDFSCRTFLLEAYKARTRLAQVTIVDPAAPGVVRPIGGFEAAEVARVMGELNADPTRNYGAGAMRKAAIAEAITRPNARQQCWGSITRWLLLDKERRNGRGESLAHGMGGLKVRCGAAHSRLRAAHAFKPAAAAAARLSVLETRLTRFTANCSITIKGTREGSYAPITDSRRPAAPLSKVVRSTSPQPKEVAAEPSRAGRDQSACRLAGLAGRKRACGLEAGLWAESGLGHPRTPD